MTTEEDAVHWHLIKMDCMPYSWACYNSFLLPVIIFTSCMGTDEMSYCIVCCTVQPIYPYEIYHDDVMPWRCFPHYRHFMRGIHWSMVDSPHKGPVMWKFDVSFVVSLNKLLNTQPCYQWFEMPWWCSCDITVMYTVLSVVFCLGFINRS